MKRLLPFLMIALVAAVPAAAENWYADVFTGYSQTDDTAFGVNGTSRIMTSFDDDMSFGVSVGYNLDNPWRFELELTRRESEVDSHNLDMGGPIAGSFGEGNSTSLFANAFYDFNNGSRFTPYLGIGIGNVGVDYANFGVPGLDALDDDGDAFGYQLVAGVAIEISARFSFSTDYRLLEAEDVTLTSSAATGNTVSDVGYGVNELTLGVRFKF